LFTPNARELCSSVYGEKSARAIRDFERRRTKEGTMKAIGRFGNSKRKEAEASGACLGL
jgi:hypothetical protein